MRVKQLIAFLQKVDQTRPVYFDDDGAYVEVEELSEETVFFDEGMEQLLLLNGRNNRWALDPKVQ